MFLENIWKTLYGGGTGNRPMLGRLLFIFRRPGFFLRKYVLFDLARLVVREGIINNCFRQTVVGIGTQGKRRGKMNFHSSSSAS